ncbi:hypothetical protein BC628DRAFT_1423184 [Trametes gibbosa]|nr:hypothetical protein BC628DRAFT_1423184 [Trametes gibbosa]
MKASLVELDLNGYIEEMYWGLPGGDASRGYSREGQRAPAHPVRFLVVRIQRLDGFDGDRSKRCHKTVKDFPNFEDVLRCLCEADPALADVVLDIEGKGYKQWALHGGNGGGGLRMRLLDNERGRALVRAEGLDLDDKAASWLEDEL